MLGPVDDERSELSGSGGDSLVHEDNVSVSGGSGLLDAGERRLGGKVVPVLRVDVGLDDAVVVGGHVGLDGPTGGEVWSTHVSWADTNDVYKGLLETLHLGLDLRAGVRAHVGVRPGVGTDLVAGIESLLDGGSAVVDTAIQSTGDEEGSLGSGSVESVDQLIHVGAWSVIESEGNDTWAVARRDDGTSCWLKGTGKDDALAGLSLWGGGGKAERDGSSDECSGELHCDGLFGGIGGMEISRMVV